MTNEFPRVPRLILIKHATPAIDRTKPAACWPLRDDGRAACGPLADLLVPYRPTVIVSSREPKAIETATIVAARLGTAMATAADLHEHDRRNVPWIDGLKWTETMRRFFAHPDDLIVGRETAGQARNRFARAVSSLLRQYPTDTVTVVAHGTVISLFVTAQMGEESSSPFDLWQRLGVPSFVVLTRPGLAVERIVAKIPLAKTVNEPRDGETR